jgi:hypothetical protein
MHRLIFPWLTAIALVASGCGGKKAAVDPTTTGNDKDKKDETKTGDEKKDDEKKGDEKKDDEKKGDEKKDEPKKDDCTQFEVSNLEDLLVKSACEVPNAKPDSLKSVDLKGKLDVTVAASPTKIAPGGKAELVVAFVNKSKDPITLNFRIDPTARFEVEVYDKKNARAEMPPGPPPPPPKGATTPPPTEPKVAHVTLTANGSARVRIPWEAVKTKWAPEKFRGTPPEKGYPRVAAGPLNKGKYTVKVVTPLVGVADYDMGSPKLEIELK